MKMPSKTLRIALAAALGATIAIGSRVTPAGAQQPYIGEIITFAGNFCPVGYQPADGSLLQIFQYQSLFNVIEFLFGGDGQSTFGVPNLQGATIMGTGQGTNLPPITIGQTGGNANTAKVQTATAKSVEVPATQSPSLALTQCIALIGFFPSRD
jgi:microcystin-dependent protein